MNILLGDTLTTSTLTSVAAVMEQTIQKLLASKYPPPDWLRQGPNFAKNVKTGEVVNLNQEAQALIRVEEAKHREQGVTRYTVEDYKSAAPVIQPIVRVPTSEEEIPERASPVLPILAVAAAYFFLSK